MQALILAGGQGTRLRPLTLNIPKPIVPICNQPFLFRQIELLKTAGITDIILSLNYHPSYIKEILGDGSAFGVQLKYLIEPEPRGTAGAYKFAEESLNTSTIVLNGDILTDINLQDVVNQHKNLNAAATIVLTVVENPSAYGLVETDKNLHVLNFLEKPDSIENNKLNTINAGIYVLEPQVLDLIPANENYSFEYHLFPKLLERGEKFYAFVANDSYWLDIGTLPRYLQANQDLLAGKIKNFEIKRSNDYQINETARIDSISCLEKGCIIKDRVTIINSVLGCNVIVEEGAVIKNSVIWSETKIAANAKILDSVVGYERFEETSGDKIFCEDQENF